MDPFVNVLVQPSYGSKSCFVRWRVLPGFEQADVYVYKSDDGQTGWTLLNPDNPVRGQNWFEDDNFIVGNLTTTIHYRLFLEFAGQEFDSPVVGIFDTLNRREFAAVRRIMQVELFSLVQGRQGIEVRLLKPLQQGKTCRCVDPVTKQSSQASLCPYCYGTKIEGGYGRPIHTWMMVYDWARVERLDDPSGRGRSDKTASVVRALAIPQMATDDIIVHLETDRRLAVTDVETEYFRGIIPVMCTPNLVLLPRSDVRYQIPVSSSS